jgi:hypothetical protein
MAITNESRTRPTPSSDSSYVDLNTSNTRVREDRGPGTLIAIVIAVLIIAALGYYLSRNSATTGENTTPAVTQTTPSATSGTLPSTDQNAASPPAAQQTTPAAPATPPAAPKTP